MTDRPKRVKSKHHQYLVPERMIYFCAAYNDLEVWRFNRNRRAELHGFVGYQCVACDERKYFDMGELEEIIKIERENEA